MLTFLLTHLLFDDNNHRLIPSHAQKRTKRYRYYVSEDLHITSRAQAPQGMRLPAQDVETIVVNALADWLSDANGLLNILHPRAELIQTILERAKFLANGLEDMAPLAAGHQRHGDHLPALTTSTANTATIATQSDTLSNDTALTRRYEVVHLLVREVMVKPEGLTITVYLNPLLVDEDKLLTQQGRKRKIAPRRLQAIDANQTTATQDDASPTYVLHIPTEITRVGLAMRLLVNTPAGLKSKQQAPDERILRSWMTAHEWLGRLTSGEVKSAKALEAQEKISEGWATRMMYRVFLAPKIVRALLDGTQPMTLTPEKLKRNLPLPLDWDEQYRVLGFPRGFRDEG